MASAGDPAVILCKLEPVKRRRRHLGPKRPSVTAMLADLAEGLHAGRPVGDGSQSLTTGVWTGKLLPAREPCG